MPGLTLHPWISNTGSQSATFVRVIPFSRKELHHELISIDVSRYKPSFSFTALNTLSIKSSMSVLCVHQPLTLATQILS